MTRIAPDRLARLRAASQLLHRPRTASHPADVARGIAGAQAQDKRPGLLQFRSRSRELTAAEVERARVEERSLVRGWLMRGTVHLVAADDYPWMLSLFAEEISRTSRRRLGQLGVEASTQDRAVAAIGSALAADGPLPRSEVVERLSRAGVELNPETRVHLMRVVVAEGVACIGPDQGQSGSLVASEDWLGARPAPDRDDCLAELARRFLGAFAPASERDLAKWSGLSVRDCRLGLERIASELAELDSSGLLGLRAASVRAPRAPLVRLLPAFDTYLMGYASREHAVDAGGERRILPGGGVLKPTLCVDGRLVGLWSSRRSGRRLEVTVEPFAELGPEWIEPLEAEVADLGRYEGVEARLAG